MTYRVEFIPHVRKDLEKIPRHDVKMIKDALISLSKDKEPWRHVKKLKGAGKIPVFSFRIGVYRAIMTIERGIMVIFVIEISHRKNAYRKY
jgi:mRNA interferase RelE/StbE